MEQKKEGRKTNRGYSIIWKRYAMVCGSFS